MNEALLPILASLLTLLLTKAFDMFMAKRRESLDKITLTLTAADEVAEAAATTIGYLREELKDAREREAELLGQITTLTLEKNRLEQALLICEQERLKTEKIDLRSK